jgi:molybdopterin-biosynthesis enzyme MoeA-like protein
MPDRPVLSRALLKRAENVELSLGSLEAISEIRAYLDELEKQSMASAREKGATVEDIAEALRLTPQAIYYRLRNEKMNLQVTPGEPNVADPALEETAGSALPPESTLAAAVTDAPEDPGLLPEPTLPD